MMRRSATADPRQLDLPLGAAGDGLAGASHDARSAPPPATGSAHSVSVSSAAVSAASPAAPRAPSLFRHPRAVREIDLGRAVVAYAFQRARRRSIGMVVSAEGLSVRAPRWVGWTEIEAALREKAGWIEAKLLEQHERARRHAAARIEWCDGTSVPYLGETVIVVLDPRTTGAVLDARAEALPGVPRPTLHVGLPQQAAPEQVRDVVQAWLKRQARRVFEERCAHFAPRLGVRVARLALSSAQTRWGSASASAPS